MQLKHDVFISYSRVDENFAKALFDSLESSGLRIWMDRGGIAGGSLWENEIKTGLRGSRMMILIMSESSMGSKWVRREISLADNTNKTILPVKIEDLKPTTDIPWCLEEIQWVIVEQEPLRSLDNIVVITRKILDAMPSSSPIEITPLSTTKPVIETPTEENLEDPGLKISRTEFLEQCWVDERSYFTDVLTFCESHPSQIIIDWGTKGFSVKDKNRRQILWMFPQEGANSKSNINARLQKLTDEEKAQIMEILRSNGISKGLSWRPGDLPLAELKKIINLVCGT